MTADELEVHHLNVGQGHATLLVGPAGETTLVDTGGSNVAGPDVDVTDHVSDHVRRLGQIRDDVDGVDNLVLTHLDRDHCEGAADLAARHAVDDVYTPTPDSYDLRAGSKPSDLSQAVVEALNDLDTASSLSVHSDVDAGSDLDLFESDAVAVDVQTPGARAGTGGDGIDEVTGVSWNEASLSFGLHHSAGDGPGDHIGITGDNEDTSDSEYDHLLAPHHGSGNNAAVVAETNPTHLTVSSAHADRNANAERYGHPGEALRSRAPASVTWTPRNGTVSVVSDGTGGGVDVYTQYGDVLDPEELSHDAIDGEDLPAVAPGFSDAYRERRGASPTPTSVLRRNDDAADPSRGPLRGRLEQTERLDGVDRDLSEVDATPETELDEVVESANRDALDDLPEEVEPGEGYEIDHGSGTIEPVDGQTSADEGSE